MIQRMSDQHNINFLKDVIPSEKVAKVESIQKTTLDQMAEEQKAKRLSNKDDGMMTTQHIFSARTGNISNEGGPSKHVKNDSSNTIWNANRTSEASQEMDSKTKTIQDKTQISSNKREAENQRMDSLVDNIKSTIQEKASTVSPAGTLSGTNYQVSNNSMSIFDNKDFMRLSEKTGGEQISEDIKSKNSQVDDSWRGGGKVVSSKDITKGLFEGLFDKSE